MAAAGAGLSARRLTRPPQRPRYRPGGRQRAAACCLLLAQLFFSAAALAGDWQRVFTSATLWVDQRPYPGSALREIRGVARVAASLNALMALLKDAAFNRHWVYRSGGAKILEQNGYRQAYVYGVVDAPWPMQDRDTVVRFDYSQAPDTRVITITITNCPDFLPRDPRYVRVPDFGGHWQLRPLADGWVEVTYQVFGDPGGWIPVWVANYAAVTSVTRTLQALPEVVGRYRDAASVYVLEPGPILGYSAPHRAPAVAPGFANASRTPFTTDNFNSQDRLNADSQKP